MVLEDPSLQIAPDTSLLGVDVDVDVDGDLDVEHYTLSQFQLHNDNVNVSVNDSDSNSNSDSDSEIDNNNNNGIDNDNDVTPTIDAPVAPPAPLVDSDPDDGYDESQKNTFTIVAGNKKISDSRLSLAQLSIVLHLENNEEETAKREKNILQILKTDLNFPIGEKTWIRDTPSHERERIIKQLTFMVEEKFHYGYSKRTLSIIVRRASYYMMQGRLRRERRQQRKRKQSSQLTPKISDHESD